MPPKATKPRLTHFLCLPLVTPNSRAQLQRSLTAFCADITKNTHENPGGIPETAVRPIGTLHLTLGVMSLLTDERVEQALGVLQKLDLQSLIADGAKKDGDAGGEDGQEKEKGVDGTEALRVTLRGLRSMHTPSQTSILFSSPLDPENHLQRFCQSLKNSFTAEGLIVPDTRPLLLHATMINTIYVPGVRGSSARGRRGRGGGGDGGEGHGKNKAKLTIDATEILADYEETEWITDVRVEKVAICRMGARKGEDGEEAYVVEGEVDMP